MLRCRFGNSGGLKHFDPVALCNKPGSPDICLGKLGAHDRQFGARLNIVKPDEYFSLYDEVSFFHSDLTDDPAVAVLNSLEVLVDIDGAGGDHSTGKLRRRRPTASDSDQQEAERAAGKHPPSKAEGSPVVVHSVEVTGRPCSFLVPAHPCSPLPPLCHVWLLWPLSTTSKTWLPAMLMVMSWTSSSSKSTSIKVCRTLSVCSWRMRIGSSSLSTFSP